MPQASNETLVLNCLAIARQAVAGITRAIHLGESDMPGRVSVQSQEWAKNQEKIGFWFHRYGVVVCISCRLGRMHGDLADFRVDQFRGDVLGRDFATLRHLRKCLGQIDKGLSAVGGGEKEDGQRLGVGFVSPQPILRVSMNRMVRGKEL